MDHTNNPYPYHNPAPPLSYPQTYPSSSYSNPNPSDGAALWPPGVVDPHPTTGAGYNANLYPPPAPATATANLYYQAAAAEAIQQQFALNYGMVKKMGPRKRVEDLESKKRKIIEGGTSAESVRVCSICNVVCNSDMVFASHLAGEKHTLKVLGMSSNGTKLNFSAPLKAVYRAAKKAANPTPPPIANKKKGLIAFVQSFRCEVCNIDCNSQEAFNSHNVGKKHRKNVQKLQDSKAPKPASTPVTTVDQKVSTVAAKGKSVSKQPVEDLETKKQKLLDVGVAADAVRVCTICNVVCNSETVFNFHIRGQKHLSMLKQQAASVS